MRQNAGVIQHKKCMWEHIKKKGVFVRVCTLLSELIAMGILGLL